ncbi:MAG TPA: branched-chain amino acid ABC transporter permease [Anaerolineae bacterium]
MTAVASQLDKVGTWVSQRQQWLWAILFIVALVFPFAIRPYYLSLAIEVLVFAIFAMSLDLLLGYTGLPSFGHAAFFGLGAYLVAYIASTNERALGLTSNLLLTVPVVVSVTAVVALIIGFFALRTSGIYFLMITLAFAQMLFSIAIRWSGVTGGSDGLPGVQRPVLGVGSLAYEFTSRESYYFLVLAFFLLSWWLLRRIVNSPFGWTLRGIRENEQRMRALGYNTFRYKMAAFAVSGAFAGLAGMLLVHFFRHASPENLYWTTSGEVLIMLIVGGTGTLTGPILGAGLVRLFPLLVSSYIDRWRTLEGLLFIAFVLFAPKGIIGLLRGRRDEELT